MAAGHAPMMSDGASVGAGFDPHGARPVLPQRLLIGLAALVAAVELVFAAWLGRGFLAHPVVVGGVIAAVGLVVAAWLSHRGHAGWDAHVLVASIFLAAWTFLWLRWQEGPDPFLIAGTMTVPVLAATLLRPVPTAVYGFLGLAGLVALRWSAPFGQFIDVEGFVIFYFVASLSVCGSWLLDRERTTARALGLEADEGDRTLRGLAEALPDAIWVLQEDLSVQLVNRAAMKWFPGPSDATLDALLPASWVAPIRALVAKGGDGRLHQWNYHDSERGIDWEAQVQCPPTPRAGPYVLTLRDVTARRKAEEVESRALKEARTATLNMVSHDIRTPLTSAILKGHLLRAGALGALNKKQYLNVNAIVQSMEKVGETVELFIQAARLTGGSHSGVQRAIALATTLEEAFRENGVGTLQNDVPESIRVQADAIALHVALRMSIKCLLDGNADPLHAWSETDGSLVHMFIQPLGAKGRFEPIGIRDSAEDERSLGMTVARAAVEQHGGHFHISANEAAVERWRLTWPTAPAPTPTSH